MPSGTSMLPSLAYTSAQSIGGYWQHAASQFLLWHTRSLPLSPSAGTDSMRLVSFSYACRTLLLSPSAGADGIRLVRIFLYRTGSLPLSPSAGITDGIRLVSVFLACETHLHGPSAGANSWACLHSPSRYALAVATWSPYALPCSSRLLSSSLPDSVCCSPPFSSLLLFYICNHDRGLPCHWCLASTNPFADFDAWSCFTADIPQTLGWAHRCYFVTYIITTFNFTRDWTPNIP